MPRYRQKLQTAVLAGGFASTQSWYSLSECTKPKNKTSQAALRKDFMVKWQFAHPHLATQQDVMDRAWNQRKDDPSAMELYNKELDEKIRRLNGARLNSMFTPVTSQKTLNEAAGQRQAKEDFILQRPRVPSVSSMPPLKVSQKVVVPRSLIVPIAEKVSTVPKKAETPGQDRCKEKMVTLGKEIEILELKRSHEMISTSELQQLKHLRQQQLEATRTLNRLKGHAKAQQFHTANVKRAKEAVSIPVYFSVASLTFGVSGWHQDGRIACRSPSS